MEGYTRDELKTKARRFNELMRMSREGLTAEQQDELSSLLWIVQIFPLKVVQKDYIDRDDKIAK